EVSCARGGALSNARSENMNASTLRPGGPSLAAYCAHDEPLGRRADEVKRITGDERQRSDGGRIEYRDILRVDDPNSVDVIRLASRERLELDRVAGGNILEASEESVTMTGNPAVAVRPRQRRVVDVADGAIEDEIIRAR